MSLPPLFGPGRRGLAIALGSAGLAQAAAAAIAAAAASGALAEPARGAQLVGAMVLGGGLLAGAVWIERRVGEGLAQSLVVELRQGLFGASIAAAHRLDRSRLAVPFVGDLAAVRNWAARGPVRLLGAGLAWGGSLAALGLLHPALWMSAVPLALAPLVALPVGRRLRRVIGRQRDIRGGMTRFILRRLERHAQRPDHIGRGAADAAELGVRSGQLAEASVARAMLAADLEAVAVLAGGVASALAILAIIGGSGSPAAAAGALPLVGFVAARLRDMARAEHARIAGEIALRRIAARLAEAREAATRPSSKEEPTHAV